MQSNENQIFDSFPWLWANFLEKKFGSLKDVLRGTLVYWLLFHIALLALWCECSKNPWRNDVVKAKNDVFLGFLMISGQMIPRNHKVLHMVIYSIYPATSYEILFNFNLGKEEYPKCHMLLCRRNKCVCIIQNWQIRKILFEFMQRNVGCFSTMKSRETRCYIMKFSYIFLE